MSNETISKRVNRRIDDGVRVTNVKLLPRTYRWERRKPAVRVYVWVEGENMLENFANRFDRPTKLYRKALPIAFDKLGINPDEIDRIVWSQKAGCGCGCSPGFVLRGTQNRGYDIHIQLTVDTPQETTAEGAERAEQLLAQIA